MESRVQKDQQLRIDIDESNVRTKPTKEKYYLRKLFQIRRCEFYKPKIKLS